MEADPGNFSDSHDGNDTDECEFDTVPVEDMTEERALPEAEAALAQETWNVLFLQTYGSSLFRFTVALCMLTGSLFITGCWMVKEAWKSFAFCRTLVHLWALIASIAIFFVFLVPLPVLMCRWQLRGRFLHLSGALICATGLWDLLGLYWALDDSCKVVLASLTIAVCTYAVVNLVWLVFWTVNIVGLSVVLYFSMRVGILQVGVSASAEALEINNTTLVAPEDRETMSCSICLQNFHESHAVVKTNRCGHVFHKHCLCRWVRVIRNCPLCRGDLGANDAEKDFPMSV